MEPALTETILVAVDFSDHSNIAVQQAMLIAARRQNARIVLCWADEHSTQSASGIELLHSSLDSRDEDQSNSARVKLEILADRVKSNGIDVVIRMEAGYADEAIVHVASQVKASLIVVGTRGLTGFKRFLLGSVAEKIVRTSPTNVVVARGEPSAFSRVLVATDFSPASEHALQVAMAMAAPDAHIDILHAWQYPPGIRGAVDPSPTDGPLAGVARDIINRAERLGEALTKRYASDARTVEFTNVFGAPGAIIHQRLESNMYDMVAMGTHGHRGFRRFLLGSVAEATVRHAPCSVLVTHTASAQ